MKIKKRYYVLLILGMLLLVNLAACNKNNEAQDQHQQFINQLMPEAQQLYATYHILPSITLAQAILESNWGTSTLATKYHNLFGVKGNPQNAKLMTTKEYINGQWQTIKDYFRIYPSFQDAMKEHALLFINGTSWNKNQYRDVLQANNYQMAAEALLKDGYATDPTYPKKLIQIIQKYHLSQYDKSN